MKTGKYTVIFLFSVLLISDGYRILSWLFTESQPYGFVAIFTFTLAAVLFSGVYQGKEWARITTSILLSFEIIGDFFLILLFLHPAQFVSLAFNALFLYALTVFRPVGKFMNEQELRYEPGEVVNASQPAGLSENHLHD